ncbi:translation initiation factor IF-2-like [Cebus imitator]|uniref:translation initiation factor IF-2-like n=1 Tax=Cebus imitator TaxID=2715852 RepID=UPI000809E603|nr:translation initiation factor IF-2-like [Cebus imitator]
MTARRPRPSGRLAPARSGCAFPRCRQSHLEKEEAAAGRSPSGPGCGSGRERAQRGQAGPVSAAPCPQRGRREAQGALWPGGGAAFLAGRLRPRRRWAPGAGLAAACRPRAAAAGGPTDGKGRGSCQRVAGPLRWRNLLFLPRLAGALLSLSLSLTLSLPGWKFPLTSREHTDRRTHARTQRGREVGSLAGVGEARIYGGALRPRPGLASGLGSRPSGPLRGAGRGARVRRPGRPCPLQGSGFPAGRSRTPRAGAGRDAPRKRLPGPIVRERRRRGGGGGAADKSHAVQRP